MTDESLPRPGHTPAGYTTGLYTADQMRAYGAARADAAIERCAVLLDRTWSMVNDLSISARSSNYYQGQLDVLEKSASAIRALKGST